MTIIAQHNWKEQIKNKIVKKLKKNSNKTYAQAHAHTEAIESYRFEFSLGPASI